MIPDKWLGKSRWGRGPFRTVRILMMNRYRLIRSKCSDKETWVTWERDLLRGFGDGVKRPYTVVSSGSFSSINPSTVPVKMYLVRSPLFFLGFKVVVCIGVISSNPCRLRT